MNLLASSMRNCGLPALFRPMGQISANGEAISAVFFIQELRFLGRDPREFFLQAVTEQEAHSRGLLFECHLLAYACSSASHHPGGDSAGDRVRLRSDTFGQLSLHAEGFLLGRVDLIFLLSVLDDY